MIIISHITSHHIDKTEAGLESLCIRKYNTAI